MQTQNRRAPHAWSQGSDVHLAALAGAKRSRLRQSADPSTHCTQMMMNDCLPSLEYRQSLANSIRRRSRLLPEQILFLSSVLTDGLPRQKCGRHSRRILSAYRRQYAPIVPDLLQIRSTVKPPGITPGYDPVTVGDRVLTSGVPQRRVQDSPRQIISNSFQNEESNKAALRRACEAGWQVGSHRRCAE